MIEESVEVLLDIWESVSQNEILTAWGLFRGATAICV
jgi:hypothetical protein